MSTQTRNMARMIWVNISLPPTDTQPAYAKGKTPTSEVTASQLKQRKIEALRLCLSFVFATKHYLRGEDGVNWADLRGILPAFFTRFDQAGSSSHKNYAAIGDETMSTKCDASTNSNGSTSPESKPDATKRVRVKRSKQKLSDQSTPLLRDTYQNAEFHHPTSEDSLPLPLVYVSLFRRLSSVLKCSVSVLALHMNSLECYTTSDETDFSRLLALLASHHSSLKFFANLVML